MTSLYLPAPIRIAVGHKKLRDPMRLALQLSDNATVFDLSSGALNTFLGREGWLQVASILNRPAVAGMPISLSPNRVATTFEKALLRPSMTPIKLLPSLLSDWESWRGMRVQAIQGVRAVLEHERHRFNATGFAATDPELQVPPQRVADDVQVTHVLDLLLAGELELAPWRPWLTTVVDMAHTAADDGEREARMRWHVAVVCQHLWHEKVLAAMERRLGLEGEPWTLEACGQYAGVTKERIRQLEGQVLDRVQRDHYLGDGELDASSVAWSVAA